MFCLTSGPKFQMTVVTPPHHQHLKSQVKSFLLLNCHGDLSHAQSLTNIMSRTEKMVKSGRKAERRCMPSSTLPLGLLRLSLLLTWGGCVHQPRRTLELTKLRAEVGVCETPWSEMLSRCPWCLGVARKDVVGWLLCAWFIKEDDCCLMTPSQRADFSVVFQ